MSLSSYSGLQTAVATLLMRDDLAAAIPDWITMCEADVQRSLQVQDMEAITTLTFSANSVSVSLPSDYSTFRAAYFDTTSTSISASPFTIPSVTAQILFSNYISASTGRPQAFSIIGQTIRVAPVPDTKYYMNLIYYQNLPALSNTNTTNWLLKSYPDAYLYGTALHSAPYLNDDARIQTWAGLYSQALGDIKAQDLFARYGGTPLQVKVS